MCDNDCVMTGVIQTRRQRHVMVRMRPASRSVAGRGKSDRDGLSGMSARSHRQSASEAHQTHRR